MHINPTGQAATASGSGNKTYLEFSRNVYACCTSSTTITICNAAGETQHSFLMNTGQSIIFNKKHDEMIYAGSANVTFTPVAYPR